MRPSPLLLLLPLLVLACSKPTDPAPPAGPPEADLPVVDLAAREDGRTWTYSEPREACSQRTPTRRALFGDLHAHTGLSFDAWAYGNRADPAMPFRYAQGEAVVPLTDGRSVQLARALDFAAVSDHAEFLGEVALCTDPGHPAYDGDFCTRYRAEPESGVTDFGLQCTQVVPERMDLCEGEAGCLAPALEARWAAVQQAAEDHYDRTPGCRFTTFVGYEYTRTPDVNNLHRLVLFRNRFVPRAPATGYEAPTAWHLWASLLRDCLLAGTGCDAMTVAHNTNLSSGAMYAPEAAGTRTREERAYRAQVRAYLEPVLEVFQHKGASECRNGVGTTAGDPACGFEQQWPADAADCGESVGRLGMRLIGCTSRWDYARGILLEGLREERQLGVNPYALGLLANTDTHNATPGRVEEDDFAGHVGWVDDTPLKRFGAGTLTHDTYIDNGGGLTAVWAEENSRDAIFSALRRREVFATSGPRIQVRLFAGWSYPETFAADAGWEQRAYDGGVPMGARLPARGAAKAPVILAWAQADQSRLERLELIKGFLDQDGTPHEAVIGLGRAASSAFDRASCGPNPNGEERFWKVWTDPSFDPAVPAFYYLRVLESPTCRWSSWDCERATGEARPGACDDPSREKTVQERAWSSPVWYVPE